MQPLATFRTEKNGAMCYWTRGVWEDRDLPLGQLGGAQLRVTEEGSPK